MQSALPPLYQQARLVHLPRALRAILAQRRPEQGLYLFGAAGVGKTYAAAAAARPWAVKGAALRWTWEGLCLAVRDTFGTKARGAATEKNLLARCTGAALLILEDVGTSSGHKTESDFNCRLLWMILDARLEARKPTVITSNRSIEELEMLFDARIGSRLKTFLAVQLSGPDRREPPCKGIHRD